MSSYLIKLFINKKNFKIINTIKFLPYTVFVLLLSISIISCSGDDGSVGPVGANGTNGTDGNANVQTYTFDVSAEIGFQWSINTPQLTNDILDNDGILTYLKNNNNLYYFVPGTSFEFEIKTFFSLLETRLVFYNRLTGANLAPAFGDFTILKLVIIESSSTTAGRGVNTLTPKEKIQNELENASIDINNYYAVCEYYGINPE
ncbi:MAG: hypothetical protein V3U80_08380 [Flavobacteriaceae bacterium]